MRYSRRSRRSRRLPFPKRRAGPVCPLGRAARRAEHHQRRRLSRGAVGQAGGGLHRQVRDKATESFGSALDQRLTADDDLDRLDQLPAHGAELVRACWALGGRPELEELRLRAWAHMLGFGGHWSTKSRRYSTTFTVLRRARVTFAKRHRAKDGVPLDAWGRPEDDQA